MCKYVQLAFGGLFLWLFPKEGGISQTWRVRDRGFDRDISIMDMCSVRHSIRIHHKSTIFTQDAMHAPCFEQITI